MIKGVIFDIDNTLTDFMRTKRAAVDAAVEMMIDAGLKADKETMKQKIMDLYFAEGVEDQKIFNKILKKELGYVDIRILAAGITGYRRAKNGMFALYPRVSSVLFELRAMGIKMTVLSDAPKLEVWLRIVGLGLHHHFKDIITSEDFGARKPDPKPFKAALKVLGTKPAQTLMVGDWPERDVAGAKKLGIKTAWAKYGDTFGTKPGESGADWELDYISQLPKIIRKENGWKK
jgi:putative hydrolase of the HAD superfamily